MIFILAQSKQFDYITKMIFLQFSIWDTPGQLDFLDPMSSLAFDIEAIFGGCSALIFVIDAQVHSKYVV